MVASLAACLPLVISKLFTSTLDSSFAIHMLLMWCRSKLGNAHQFIIKELKTLLDLKFSQVLTAMYDSETIEKGWKWQNLRQFAPSYFYWNNSTQPILWKLPFLLIKQFPLETLKLRVYLISYHIVFDAHVYVVTTNFKFFIISHWKAHTGRFFTYIRE